MRLTFPSGGTSGGGGGGMSIGGAIGGGATAGSVLFVGAGGVLAQDNANFFWDATNHRLGIGTTTPQAGIQIIATTAGNGAFQLNGGQVGNPFLIFYNNTSNGKQWATYVPNASTSLVLAREVGVGDQLTIAAGGALTVGAGVTIGGNLAFSADNSFSVGNSASNRASNVFSVLGTFGTSAAASGTIRLGNNNSIKSNNQAGNADLSIAVYDTSNILQLGDGTNSGVVISSGGTSTIIQFNGRLQFNGTTNAFPALKRSGTTAAFRLADDSADAPISTAGITASGAIVPNADGTIDLGSQTGPVRFREINSSLYSYCTAQLDKTGDTALANVVGLSATLLSGGIYAFLIIFQMNAPSAGGFKFDLAGGGVTATATRWTVDENVGNTQATALNTAIGTTPGATNFEARISGYIQVNNGGTLIPRFAQQAASGTSSVFIGSYMIVWRVG